MSISSRTTLISYDDSRVSLAPGIPVLSESDTMSLIDIDTGYRELPSIDFAGLETRVGGLFELSADLSYGFDFSPGDVDITLSLENTTYYKYDKGTLKVAIDTEDVLSGGDLPPFSGPLVNRVCSPFVCHHSAA